MLDPKLENIDWNWQSSEKVPCPLCKTAYEECSFCLNEFGFDLVRCPQCDMVTVNPRPSWEELDSFYDNYYPPESSEMWAEQMSNVFLNEGRAFFRKNKIPPGKALDVGCGYGYYLKFLREDDWEVKGVEPSKGPADYANKELKIDVYNGILETADYANESFDHISLWYVLEHVLNPDEIIANCVKLLKKDGILLIRVPNNNISVDKKLSLFGQKGSDFYLINPPRHLNDFNKNSLSFLMGKHNMEILTLQNRLPRSTGTFLQLARRHLWYKKSQLQHLLSGGNCLTGSSITVFAKKN